MGGDEEEEGQEEEYLEDEEGTDAGPWAGRSIYWLGRVICRWTEFKRSIWIACCIEMAFQRPSVESFCRAGSAGRKDG
jgi:hypothetical protein